MRKQWHSNKIFLGTASLILLFIVLFTSGSRTAPKNDSLPDYASRLFDDSRVHTIDIQIDDWKAFVKNASNEE